MQQEGQMSQERYVYNRMVSSGMSITEALRVEQSSRENNYRALEERYRAIESSLADERKTLVWMDRRSGSDRRIRPVRLRKDRRGQ